MIEMLNDEASLASQTHATGCCEGGRRPFSQRKDSPTYQQVVVQTLEEAARNLNDRPCEVESVIQERESVYGPPSVNLDCISQHWQAYRINQGERKESLLDVCYRNILQKISRLARTPNHRDSIIDIIGYAEIALEHLDEESK